jgi:hypothetical protein
MTALASPEKRIDASVRGEVGRIHRGAQARRVDPGSGGQAVER